MRERCLWCGRRPGWIRPSRPGWTRLPRRYVSVVGDRSAWVCPGRACLSGVHDVLTALSRKAEAS